MERYAAFLRGINVSGKNKIAMSELKADFEELGFENVSTYLNSGNVSFSSDIDNARRSIESMIAERYGLNIPAYVIKMSELRKIVSHAPSWWGTEDKEIYHNLIFILSSDSADEICKLIGEPSDGLKQIQCCNNVIFWSFDRRVYQRCHWWKATASTGIAEKLTIRTAGTIRRLCK